jgi:hypothetical protein
MKPRDLRVVEDEIVGRMDPDAEPIAVEHHSARHLDVGLSLDEQLDTRSCDRRGELRVSGRQISLHTSVITDQDPMQHADLT